MTGRKTAFALMLAAALAMGCADQSMKQMTTRPKPADGGAAAERRVVLFRAVVDVGDEAMEDPWGIHWSGLRLFTVVGPAGAKLTSLHSFLPGRPDASSSDNGWGFVALPPGAYQLVFEGNAMRFAMPGAQFYGLEALPVARSPPSTFTVPADGNLVYIGTFAFTCQEPVSAPESLKLECKTLEVRDEAKAAQQIAQTALVKYGPMQEALATPPQTKAP
jgi:hypothetical protein